MAAGYSGTPLAKKLGVKPGTRVVAIGAPADYRALLDPLPEDAEVAAQLDGDAAFVHFFTAERQELEAWLPRLVEALAADGILWLSWPKKAARVETDLDGNVVRSLGLVHGLVDVKICAVDETWSGLKFVYRLADRDRVGRSSR